MSEQTTDLHAALQAANAEIERLRTALKELVDLAVQMDNQIMSEWGSGDGGEDPVIDAARAALGDVEPRTPIKLPPEIAGRVVAEMGLELPDGAIDWNVYIG